MAFYIKAAATLHSLDGCEFLGYDSASTNSPVYAIGVSLALNQNRMTQYASGTPLVRVGTNTRVFGNASHSTYNASSYGYGHVKYETDTLGYAAINQLQNVAATTTITPSQYTRGYMAWRYGTGIGSGDDVQIVWRRSGDGAYILSSLINDKGFYGANVTTQPAAIPDTSADNVSTNEVEINKIKAVLRTWGLIDN